MPLYNVEHVCKLTTEQQDQIAEAITRIHSETFSGPRLFVNVNIIDISGMILYVAGKRRDYNRIIANVRDGPSRTQEMWHSLCTQIENAWHSIVGSTGDKELRVIGLVGGVIGGFEAGFPVPVVGQDKAWMKEYLPAFRRKAEGGDVEFQELIQEIESREVFRSIVEESR